MIDFDRIIQTLEENPLEDGEFITLLDIIVRELFPGGRYRLRHEPQWHQYTLDIHHEGKYYGLRVKAEQIAVIRALKRMVEKYYIKGLNK